MVTNTQPNIFQKLISITEEAGTLDKTGRMQGTGGNYAYHKIDDVETLLRELFIKHRVFVHSTFEIVVSEQQSMEKSGGGTRTQWFMEAKATVKYINIDNPTDATEPMVFFGHGIDSQDKAPGKAQSYAMKNNYLSTFHLKGQLDPEQDDSPQGTKRTEAPAGGANKPNSTPRSQKPANGSTPPATPLNPNPVPKLTHVDDLSPAEREDYDLYCQQIDGDKNCAELTARMATIKERFGKKQFTEAVYQLLRAYAKPKFLAMQEAEKQPAAAGATN